MYEPYVAALSEYVLMPLPPWRAGDVPWAAGGGDHPTVDLASPKCSRLAGRTQLASAS